MKQQTMKRPALRVVLAFALAAALLFSLPLLPAFAATTGTTTATVEFIGGDIELLEAPSLTFTNTNISSGVYSIALSTNGNKKVKVSDNRGVGTGWELKVSLTDFNAGGGTTNSLDGASIKVVGATPHRRRRQRSRQGHQRRHHQHRLQRHPRADARHRHGGRRQGRLWRLDVRLEHLQHHAGDTRHHRCGGGYPHSYPQLVARIHPVTIRMARSRSHPHCSGWLRPAHPFERATRLPHGSFSLPQIKECRFLKKACIALTLAAALVLSAPAATAVFPPARAAAPPVEDASGSSASQSESASEDAAAPDPHEIGFFIRPRLPENQREQASYFDLRVEPGGRQALEVEIVNRNSYAIDIGVEAVSASTNAAGAIDYKTPGVEDSSLALPFTSVAAPREDVVTVPAEGSVVAYIDLVLPAASFDGVVLGGLVFEKLAPEQAQDDGSSQEAPLGAVIQNTYSYVVGVVLNETDTPVAPDFELFEIEATTLNGRPAVIHYIRNTRPVLVKGMELKLDIYREGETTPVAGVEQAVDMAPNSVLALAVFPEDGELAAGRYTSKAALTLEDESWPLKGAFEVDAETAQTLRSETTQPVVTESVFPVWAIVLIVALAAAVLLLVLLLALTARRKREEARRLRALERDRFSHRGSRTQHKDKNDESS